ncbi:MAG: ABC transporter ATP-binding protein [Chitinivibrionales bacterium]|nr:ABC transporter ATP-binding protein [Chitinivibrionales bacterium]
MENAVSISHLIKRFGSHTVLEDISLELAPGTLFGLVGLNGVGKTTLIRLLLGLLKPDYGRIAVLGHDPWRHATDFYKQCGVVLENDGFWGNLTVAENLKIFANAKQIAWSAVREYLDECWSAFPFITLGKKVKHLSRGQRMQCALCRAFMGWPQVYFFDEPTIALDVAAYEHFYGLMRKAHERGGSAIISSHQLETIDTLCTKIGILQNKVVTLVSGTGRQEGSAEWLVAASDDLRWGRIIERVTGSLAFFADGAWHCTMDEPARIVPELIRRLVEAGCDLYEFRPKTQSLKDTVRVFYQRGN